MWVRRVTHFLFLPLQRQYHSQIDNLIEETVKEMITLLVAKVQKMAKYTQPNTGCYKETHKDFKPPQTDAKLAKKTHNYNTNGCKTTGDNRLMEHPSDHVSLQWSWELNNSVYNTCLCGQTYTFKHFIL